MNSYLNGRVKTKPVYHAEALLQFGGTSRLMLADPLGKLQPSLLFKLAGKIPFYQWTARLQKAGDKRMQTLSPLREKFSCNSQKINLAIIVMVPVELTWIYWEFGYGAGNFLGRARIATLSSELPEVTAWHIKSRNQWRFKITHYTTNCSSWEQTDCSLFPLHGADNQHNVIVVSYGQKTLELPSP